MTVMFFFSFSRRSTSHRFAPRDSGGPRLAGKPERIRTEDHIWLVIGLLWGERGTLPACGCQGLLSILRKLPSLRSKYVVSEIKGLHLQMPSASHSGCCVMKNEDHVDRILNLLLHPVPLPVIWLMARNAIRWRVPALYMGAGDW